MDPITMAAIMGGTQLLSSFMQADAIRANNRIQQRINAMNIRRAELDEFEAIKFGATQEARYKSVVDATMASQALTMAANDVDSSFGTAAAIREESKLTAFLNTLEIQNQANATAINIQRQTSNMMLQSQMSNIGAQFQARSTEIAGVLNAANQSITGYNMGRTS